MMTLPFSIVGPAIGTIRALVIAYTFGTLRSRCTPICAPSNGGAAMTAASARVIVVRERPVCIADMLLARTACIRLWIRGVGATRECVGVGNIPSPHGGVKALQLSAASAFPSPYGRNCLY